MRRKTGLAKFAIVVGIILLLIGGFFAGRLLLLGQQVTIVRGNIETVENAKDEEFNVEVESPILVREVQMVQWYKDEDGIRKVLANYEIESFEEGNTKYNNPKFYSDIESKVFFGKATIDGKQLSEKSLNIIAENKIEEINKTQYTELDQIPAFAYNLVVEKGSYITASDVWDVGDVKVTYYYYDKNSLSNITAAGKLNNKILNVVDDSIYAGNVSDTNVKLNLYKGIEIYGGVAVVGLVLLIVGLASKPKKYKV